MSIAEVAWTVRGAVNEIDSSQVKLDSVSPLSEADEGEVTAVLALLEAVKENEAWINKYVGEEAAEALSPRRGDAPGVGEDMADEAGETRGRERQPSKSGARRSSSGERRRVGALDSAALASRPLLHLRPTSREGGEGEGAQRSQSQCCRRWC